MDRRMSASLDRYITGNWGEDQFGKQPPCCEECPEEEFNNCPGQDKCQEVYLESKPSCCIEHKIEMSCGQCCECEADMWAILDLDLTKAEDRVRVLKARFTEKYPKRIEKMYIESLGMKVKMIKTTPFKPVYRDVYIEVEVPVKDFNF